MKGILLWVIIAGALSACGTKGPLSLPQPAAAASQPAPADDSTRTGGAR
jgi:predicted small lipoprotein YifL